MVELYLTPLASRICFMPALARSARPFLSPSLICEFPLQALVLGITWKKRISSRTRKRGSNMFISNITGPLDHDMETEEQKKGMAEIFLSEIRHFLSSSTLSKYI